MEEQNIDFNELYQQFIDNRTKCQNEIDALNFKYEQDVRDVNNKLNKLSDIDVLKGKIVCIDNDGYILFGLVKNARFQGKEKHEGVHIRFDFKYVLSSDDYTKKNH